MNANFDVSKFEHYPTYDPETGSCKSYLISLADQQVELCDETITFRKDEYIFMEISQKYTVVEANQIGVQAGFKPTVNFSDSRNWFLDTLWLAV